MGNLSAWFLGEPIGPAARRLGEPVLAGVIAVSKGTMLGVTAGALGGVAGELVGRHGGELAGYAASHLADQAAEAAATRAWEAGAARAREAPRAPGEHRGRLYLAAGPTRVGFFALEKGAFGLRLGDSLGEVPRATVAAVRLRPGLLAAHLELALADGTRYALDVPWLFRGRAGTFRRLLNREDPPAPAPPRPPRAAPSPRAIEPATPAAERTGQEASRSTRHPYEGRLVAGVSALKIMPGMVVVSADGQSIGEVKAVRADCAVVGRPAQRDLYVPLTSVREALDGRLVVNTLANQVERLGWGMAPPPRVPPPMKAVVPESEKEEDEPHATGTEVAISSELATVPPDQRRTSLDGPAVGESAEADGTYGASAGVIDDTSRGAPSGPAAVSPLLSPPDPAEAMHKELSDLRNEVSRLRAELGAFRAEVLRRLPVSD